MDPVTITVMALTAISGLMKGLSNYSAGKNAKKQADRAAVQARQEGGVEAAIRLAELDEAGGELAVRAAANGGGLAGSSADALDELERKGMFNVRSAIWGAETKAENASYEGRVAKKEGTIGLISSLVETGGSLAGQYGKAGEASKQSASRQKLGS
ncbi:hypothetical protein [Phenylobacterium sp.]|uniref:hypothetical protein n=1 Tax=Phenylobacterium sp. TaxID=1871053 RepID=UPI002FC70C44